MHVRRGSPWGGGGAEAVCGFVLLVGWAGRLLQRQRGGAEGRQGALWPAGHGGGQQCRAWWRPGGGHVPAVKLRGGRGACLGWGMHETDALRHKPGVAHPHSPVAPAPPSSQPIHHSIPARMPECITCVHAREVRCLHSLTHTHPSLAHLGRHPCTPHVEVMRWRFLATAATDVPAAAAAAAAAAA